MSNIYAAIALSSVAIGSMSMVVWMYREAKSSGSGKARLKEARNELERAKKALDTLSGPLPDPDDALDQLSD